MKRITKFNRRAGRKLTGSQEQPLAEPWQMLHQQQQQNGPADPPTLETQLGTARSEVTRLTSELTAANSERDTARNDLAASQAEVTRLTNQFNALTTTATTAQGEVTRLNTELSAMTGERDRTKSELTTANTNVSRLESLCGVMGVNPKDAVPSATQPTAKLSTADWDKKISSERDPAKRQLIVAEFEKAYAAGQVA